MAGFTKLFSSIITSSIWSEDDKTRIMWITMLAISDANGHVSGAVPGMAAIARMSLKEAEKAIINLCKADPYSRSKDKQGTRLIVADGGWDIVNYRKYRATRDPEIRREQNRKAQEKYRSKQKVSQNKPQSAQAEAEAEAEAIEEEVKEEETTTTPPDGQRTTDNGDGDGDGEPGCQHTVNVPSTGGQTKLQEVSTSTSSSPKETKSHKGSPADRILSAWQKLPLPPEKKQFAAADILAIERAISILAGDSQEPVHYGMILEAIKNYHQALSLSDSQTYKHKLHPWLMEHVRKYVSYNFDIDHHRGSKYQKTGKTDTMAEMERLKAKGEL